ncbi:unnamed protein product [Laminaria digitata]
MQADMQPFLWERGKASRAGQHSHAGRERARGSGREREQTYVAAGLASQARSLCQLFVPPAPPPQFFSINGIPRPKRYIRVGIVVLISFCVQSTDLSSIGVPFYGISPLLYIPFYVFFVNLTVFVGRVGSVVYRHPTVGKRRES